ncbi:probable serine/threonine-protein kinase yakA isoform X2 [Ceratina calcarata]|uniref:Probable serine/threonine-protein kinase yakA isoform X2 n=1 Tax=Ceratina calcarata TaxID=156304 RepID=A0AAJ7WCF0_9HYME|nr:probable serine/threonine-protein kinase yakA isoform X2 [Ceratina calcarata]XP_026671271.1 probable serine/threonine-protein kinase yakA isoform X2 [Ceratina calcarata]
MLACVYPAENFKSKAVTVKLRHGRSKRKPKLLSVKEKPGDGKHPECNDALKLENELPVGGGGAVLVLSELESMAARQQREIAQQRRLLEQREARLAVLRGAQEPAQQDKLARLRHRLDQQQSKLNRLRLLRSQTDQSRANNATLTSDLDCIRALFNEKEKELSLAVAKVEELTRQLEELRGRQNAAGTGNGGGGAGGVGGGGGGGGGAGHLSTPASAELEKLRRELMYRNKMNEQQNQVVSQQRLALAQRQAEMASIDARIAQLQGRLQRKRALNQRLSQQLDSGNRTNANTGFTESKLDFNAGGKSRPAGNIAAIEPYSHIPNDNDFNLNKNDPKYQTLPYNTKFTVNFKAAEDDVNKNKIQHSASASQLGQRAGFGQQFGHQIAHSQSQSHIQGQSQLLGTNQQQHNQNLPGQPVNVQQTCNNNNNNNNNNNANSTNNNLLGSHNFGSEGLSQNLRIHHQQQSQTQQQHGNVQQKQHNVGSSASNLGTTVSITQTQNHRNLQMHQKPVSSVAPSFSVKSQIYQTSSTKIHPVMPQTLSLIGRGHSNAQNFVSLSTQNANQQQSNQPVPTSQDQTYTSRHNYPSVQHSTQANTHVYQAQNSPNAPSTILTSSSGSSYGNSVQRYNQPLSPTSGNEQSDKMKFEQGKEKFEHVLPAKHEQQRYEPNQVFKYDPHQMKYEQHSKYDQHGKYEQTNQPTKLYEQSNKHEQLGNQTIKYDNVSKPEQGKYETGQTKHEQVHGTKYDPNQNTQQYGKHDQHEVRPSVKYEHNTGFKHEPPNKYETGGQQFKQQEPVKFENNQSKFEQNTVAKHEHNGKFEILAKNTEFDRLKNENERKNMIEDKTKPALPPKPSKPNPPPRLTHHEKIDNSGDGIGDCKTNLGINQRIEKEEDAPPIPTSEPPESPTENQFSNHQIIKARPLTLKKAPISEQPKLRYAKSNVHVSINRRIEMPPAFLFPETEIPADLMQTEQQQQPQQPQIIDTTDHCKKIINEDVISNEKLEEADIIDALNVINIEDKAKTKDSERTENEGKGSEVMRRKKGNLKSSTGKANLSRRVSFDPLALLLDASLEGELELVKKTAKEVANPSSANDEGITALHNAICAGHLEIVKFLVEFGCDVNAQDSDGWTPLHCAASCNNLSMVKFLVEHGACIFATTLSDHETAAEKCEEDEEGFDGCSEYLYSVQEKLGIMNNGQVYAVFDYEAQHSDELTLKNGDSLVVLRKGDDNEREWWWSKLGHKEGYVPRNLLGLYPRVQPAKVD